MRALKNYIYFRRYRTILPSLMLVAIYGLLCFASFSYSKETLSNSSFATTRGEDLCVGFVCVIIMLFLINLVMMLKDYAMAKIRVRLLPQKQTTLLWLDIVWLCVLLLVMCSLLYFFYQRDFYRFLALLKEHQIQNYVEKRSLAYALQSQSLTAFLFPTTLLSVLHHLLLLLGAAMLIAIISTFLLFHEQISLKQWLFDGGLLLMYAIIAIYLHEVFAILWLCLLIYRIVKQACACWSCT